MGGTCGKQHPELQTPFDAILRFSSTAALSEPNGSVTAAIDCRLGFLMTHMSPLEARVPNAVRAQAHRR